MLTPFRAPEIRVSITAAARQCGLTQRAIRFYEAQGLVTSFRAASGARAFDHAGIERLNYIAFARRVGLTLRQIADLLKVARTQGAQAETARLRTLCEANLTVLDQRRRDLVAAIETLSAPPVQERVRTA